MLIYNSSTFITYFSNKSNTFSYYLYSLRSVSFECIVPFQPLSQLTKVLLLNEHYHSLQWKLLWVFIDKQKKHYWVLLAHYILCILLKLIHIFSISTSILEQYILKHSCGNNQSSISCAIDIIWVPTESFNKEILSIACFFPQLNWALNLDR